MFITAAIIQKNYFATRNNRIRIIIQFNILTFELSHVKGTFVLHIHLVIAKMQAQDQLMHPRADCWINTQQKTIQSCKTKNFVLFMTTLVNLGNIMLSKIILAPKSKYSMFSRNLKTADSEEEESMIGVTSG